MKTTSSAKPSYRVADMFCGIGGFALALHALGHKTVWACDIDPHAREMYERNFGLMPASDITRIDAAEIPDFDILCGGIPCQSFSNAGSRAGVNDPRGQLFRDLVRIMDAKQPKYAILENVRGILSANGGTAMQVIEQAFNAIGYSMQHRVLKAEDYGVPQSRRRVVFLLTRSDVSAAFNEPAKHPAVPKLADVMVPDPDVRTVTTLGAKSAVQWLSPWPDTSPRAKNICVGAVNGRSSQGYRVYHHNGLAVTQMADSGGTGFQTGLYLDPQNRVRRLDTLESKRVMGFPDSHEVGSGTKAGKRLGNAVVPAMIRAAAEACGL